MQRNYVFKLVNVFAETPFGGNPLAVFLDAGGLSDVQMQQIARQMNLSETVFVLPSERSAARLRIYTPSYELPFAGHPVLGTAAVLHTERQLGENFVLETQAAPISIQYLEGRYQLTTQLRSAESAELTAAACAKMFGVSEEDIVSTPEWISTGSVQLLIQLASRDAVLNARVAAEMFFEQAAKKAGQAIAYLWHVADGVATVRLFFEQNGQVIEDPGTGSACANLGAWHVHHGQVPVHLRVEQGEVLQRPNVLHLSVTAAGEVHVAGAVISIGEGVLHVDSECASPSP